VWVRPPPSAPLKTLANTATPCGKRGRIARLITSDLLQGIRKWDLLVRVVEQEKPRFVLVAGDLLPKDGGFEGQRRFFRVLADHFAAMRGSGERGFVFMAVKNRLNSVARRLSAQLADNWHIWPPARQHKREYL
jgi:hypothetical protein